MVTRKFEKKNSVFNKWKGDDQKVFQTCLKHDFENWKIPRFIKNEDDQLKVQKVVEKHFEILKAEHTILACESSSYPSMSLGAFTQYAK